MSDHLIEQIANNWDNILNNLELHYDVSKIIIETWIRPLSIFDVDGKFINDVEV